MKEAATELLFGGHETTASTATSLVMFLGLNSEVVQKVREEIHEKVWSKKFFSIWLHYLTNVWANILFFFFFFNQQVELGIYSPGNSLSMELLEQLKYTGCVIKETLRINPPVPGGFRVALKTFELNVS